MTRAIDDFPIAEVLRYDGTDAELVKRCTYYKRYVPKDPDKHKRWRMYVRKRCRTDLSYRNWVRKACRRDVLFFINAFCWIEEPREGEEHSGLIPFNTWVHQDCVIAAIDFYFGKRHVIIDKSRAQGASWLMLAIFLHKFLFRPRTRLGMCSKDKDTADDPDAPESLGWKFDNLLSLLPRWLTHDDTGKYIVDRNISKSTWRNRENGSTLKAHAATAKAGRAGRYTGYFFDESAHFPRGLDRKMVAGLLPTCNGIVMASTPEGQDNEHSDRLDDPQTWLTAVLDWRDNPDQNQGLYTTEDGKLKIIDVKGYPPGYAPVLDGLERSPWMDMVIRSHKNNLLWVKQEYYRDRGGSRGHPFSPELIKQARVDCKPPVLAGMLLYDEFNRADVTWQPRELGPWKIWRRLVGGRPEVGPSTWGIDIAAGGGGETSSNSIISAWEDSSCEQVAEFAAHDIYPEELAMLVFAAAHWFGRDGLPWVMPERNAGHGQRFIKALMDLGYTRILDQRPGSDERRYAKVGKLPGYHNSNRYTLLSPLIQQLTKGTITPRSHKMLDEAGEYVYDAKSGKVVHPKMISAMDGSAVGMNHGDRAVGAALAIRGLVDRNCITTVKITTPESVGFKDIHRAPAGSLGHRMHEFERARKRAQKHLCKW